MSHSVFPCTQRKTVKADTLNSRKGTGGSYAERTDVYTNVSNIEHVHISTIKMSSWHKKYKEICNLFTQLDVWKHTVCIVQFTLSSLRLVSGS